MGLLQIAMGSDKSIEGRKTSQVGGSVGPSVKQRSGRRSEGGLEEEGKVEDVSKWMAGTRLQSYADRQV